MKERGTGAGRRSGGNECQSAELQLLFEVEELFFFCEVTRGEKQSKHFISIEDGESLGFQSSLVTTYIFSLTNMSNIGAFCHKIRPSAFVTIDTVVAIVLL